MSESQRTAGLGEGSLSGGPSAGPSGADDGGGVKERASQAASEAAGTGREVASTAADQARNVVHDARDQARSLVDQTQSELRDQAQAKTQSAAAGLRTLESQVRALAEGRPEDAGPVPGYLGEVHSRIALVADRLENGGSQGVLDDVARFARRRPFMFLLAAGGAGFLAARLVRSQAAVHANNGDSNTSSPALGTTPTPALGAAGLRPSVAEQVTGPLNAPGAVGGTW